MEVYRIEKRGYLPTLLAGIPGEKFSFRWNTKGHPIIYAAESRSLALVEKLANIGTHYGGIPELFEIAVINIPNKNYKRISPNELPDHWNLLSEYNAETQRTGNKFLESNELVLYVPSVVVKGEYNALLNPVLAQNTGVNFHTENIDARLLRRISHQEVLENR